MKTIYAAASLSAIILATVCGQAQASKLCNLTGTYTEQYKVATAVIKGKKGVLTATTFCATPYTFKITNLTQTGFTVTGKDKVKSCGTFTANLTFEGSCSVFGGTVVVNGQQFSDTFTKQSGTKQSEIAHSAPAAISDLESGLR